MVHSTEMYKVIVSLRAVQAKVKSFTLVYFPWFYSLRGLHALYGVGGGHLSVAGPRESLSVRCQELSGFSRGPYERC